MMLETMYPAAVNSRQTELATNIDDTQTSFTVLDGSVLPPAPNQLTLGTDESAETIKYTGKTGNEITGVTRGFEGVAKSWVAGTKLARYFTAYDHNTFKGNIADLNERLNNIPAPQDASLTDKGIVKLSNKTDGDAENVAATEKAVNDARLSALSASQLYVNERDWQKYALTQSNGVAKQLPQSYDINNLILSGVYGVLDPTNAPFANRYYLIEVSVYNDGIANFVMQKAVIVGGGTQSYYQRSRSNAGTWSAWSVDLFTSVSDGKNAIAAAITGKNVPASGSDTFPQLATKIGQISTGPKYASGTIVIPSGTNTVFFIDADGFVQSYTDLRVTGLGFRPNRILIRSTIYRNFPGVYDSNSNGNKATTANGSNFNYHQVMYSSSSTTPDNARMMRLYLFNTAQQAVAQNGHVSDSSFSVPVAGSGTYTWEAFGV